MKDLAILVLAAGKATRMKSIKQILKINGENLLDKVLQKAITLAPKSTFCVLGAHADTIQQELNTKQIQYILNNHYDRGLSESIKSGIDFFNKNGLQFHRVLILLGDQPAIGIDYLKKMISLSLKNSDKIIGTNYGKNNGVPAIFPESYFIHLKDISGDTGAKELMNSMKNEVLSVNLSTNLVDLDTQEDYNQYINETKSS